MIRIAVDCFGGDNSPKANIDGAIASLDDFPDLHLVLSGNESIIRANLEGKKYDASRVEILDAPDVIACEDKPTDAIRLKRDSSMMKAVRLLREDDSVHGLVSTGSTGALVAAATLRIGRLRNVIRPAFCPVVPSMDGGLVGVCDSGANSEVTAEYLQQFAIMGSLYLQTVYGVRNPRVGLLNIGTESTKGDELRKQAYGLLSSTHGIDFCGNMEGRDFLSGRFDLVVCDGFSGNIMLKTMEGTAIELLGKVKKDIYSRTAYKLGALLQKRMFSDLKNFMDYQNYGGSVLLGTNKIVVKGHGSSKDKAVRKCIEQACRMQNGTINEKIEEALEKL